MRAVCNSPRAVGTLGVSWHVSLSGVGTAAWNGACPDGYVPVPGNWWASCWFIFGDQAALIVLCLSHTFEFITLKAFRLTTPAQYEAQLAEKHESQRYPCPHRLRNNLLRFQGTTTRVAKRPPKIRVGKC